jgi:hypothetical protein
MADNDDFDEIVQHLNFDLSFPEEQPEHPSVRRHRRADSRPETGSEAGPEAGPEEPVAFDDMPDEQFYRRVEPAPIRPRHRGRTLAWILVLGSPLSVVLFTLAHVWLAKSVLLGIGLTFVAGSIYLISLLPE